MSKSYPYLHKSISRHGVERWYVWRRPGPKIRIRGVYGSPEFIAAYRSALWGEKPPEKPRAAQGSLSALIDAYKTSSDWKRLSPATQRQRANIFKRVSKAAGQDPVASIDTTMIRNTRDKLGPGAAKHFVQTMRGLFQWAVKTGEAGANPTDGVTVERPATDGFHTWTEEEISAYEDRWPTGTRERLWLAILLYTGLRRGDAVLIGPRHVKNGVLTLSTGKTGVVVTLPVSSELRSVLRASQAGKETFIATVHGAPMTKEFSGTSSEKPATRQG
ncbi:site-specific integrase [Methylocystis sp. S23]